jgi:hypothetical protein
MYYGTDAPEGYLVCDGRAFSVTAYPALYALLGKATTPDMRGFVVRGYDPAGARDPDGASRAIGSFQSDAMREITAGGIVGDGDFEGSKRDYPATWGAMSWDYAGAGGKGGIEHDKARADYPEYIGNFRSSLVVPTSTEFRMCNMCLLYCIKHD